MRWTILFLFLLFLLFGFVTYAYYQQKKQKEARPKVGEKAPDFKTIDQMGKAHRLKDYRGKYVLLYFYPKDMTPGCTKEACSFRDYVSDFQKRNIVILGVSTDSQEAHQKFTKKHTLNFPLLVDEKKVITKKYGVLSPIGFAQRVSFFIDKEGIILKIFDPVKPSQHAQEVFDFFDKNVKKKEK